MHPAHQRLQPFGTWACKSCPGRRATKWFGGTERGILRSYCAQYTVRITSYRYKDTVLCLAGALGRGCRSSLTPRGIQHPKRRVASRMDSRRAATPPILLVHCIEVSPLSRDGCRSGVQVQRLRAGRRAGTWIQSGCRQCCDCGKPTRLAPDFCPHTRPLSVS
jgi:hypothetical protein